MKQLKDYVKPKLRDEILLLVYALDKTISGRTMLQKLCYILSLILKEDFRFQAHFYGPYSLHVEQALSQLIGLKFIKEDTIPWGASSNGFELIKYEYSVTDEGEYMIKHLFQLYNKTGIYEKIQEFVKQFKAIGSVDYLQLSVASKTHFVLRNGGRHMKQKEVIDKAKKLGWDISEDDIKIAVKILRGFKLIS